MAASPDEVMTRMLANGLRFAEAGDMAGLRAIVEPIPLDREQKAAHLVEVSYAQSLKGSYRLAWTAALMAAALAPASLRARVDLAARLRTFNEAGLLRHLVSASGPVRSMPIPLLLAYAAQLSYLNCQQEALDLLDEARRADPRYPPTLMARGQLLSYLGRFGEAAAELSATIAVAPEFAQAHWFLSRLERQTPASNHVQRLRERLARAPGKAGDVALLAYALHKELDDLGDTPGAWAALEQACAAKRSLLKYDPADSRALVDALVRMPSAAPSNEASGSRGGKTPIFIVGMHRSGTTLLEQLLDAHPSVLGVGELYDFTCAMRHATDHHCKGVIDVAIVQRAPRADLARAGRRYLDGIAWRLGDQSHFTDKLPSNFLNVGFICQALPQARILHMVRDPVETCFSNLRELFSEANPYSYDQRELADYYLQYRRLMANWHARFPGRILDVDYGALTRDPEGVMRGVAAFCGLDYVDGMRDPRSSDRAVATASAVQVRQGVVRPERPKWLPYADQLRPLMAALRDGGVEIPDFPQPPA